MFPKYAALAVASLAFAVIAMPTIADAKGGRTGVGVASPRPAAKSGKSHGKPTIINPPKAKAGKSVSKTDKAHKGRRGGGGTSCCTNYAHGDHDQDKAPPKWLESGADPRLKAARLEARMSGASMHRLDMCQSLPRDSQASCMGW